MADQTDLEQLRAMFDRAGVVYEEDCAEAETKGYTSRQEPDPPGPYLSVQADDGPHNHGYMGFGATISFDAQGNLVSIGVWE